MARSPNRALRQLLAEAGWSQDQLAARVTAVAAENGTVLRLDRRSVTHWLAGRRPRAPVPDLITEAFTRALNRTHTLADIGLDTPHRDPTALGSGDTHTGRTHNPSPVTDVVSTLTHLATSDGGRRALPVGAYSLAALAVPGWNQAGTQRRGPLASSHSWLPLEGGQVATVEHLIRLFSITDTAFGGGHARTTLAAYLASDIAPRLRASASPRLRTRMLSAATQLTYLCAFMCFDDEQHALAQRYYLTALDLATENNDAAAYAVTLRTMSVQALALGHHRHALQLAETAATTCRHTSLPIQQAFFHGQVAVATAATGSRISALSALAAAEHQLEQSTSHPTSGPYTDTPLGSYHPADLAYQQAAVCALLGDRKAAISALGESLRHRPPPQRRSRAITLARLAELHLHHGHIEQATTTLHTFLDDYPHLTSARATSALKILRNRLWRHSAHPAAKALLIRAADL